MLEFLYAMSDKYRLLITYIVNVAYNQSNAEPRLIYSYLFCLFMHGFKYNNHVIFKCLINHIGDVHQFGILAGKYNIPLLTAVAGKDTDGSMVEFLIERGARDADAAWLRRANVTSYEDVKSSKFKTEVGGFLIKAKQRASSVINLEARREEVAYVSQFAAINSALFAYVIHDNTSNFNVYSKLLDISSDLAVFLCLSSIVVRCRMMIIPALQNTKKYNLFSDNDLRLGVVRIDASRVQDSSQTAMGADHLGFYLLPRDANSYAFIEQIIGRIEANISSWSDERFMRVYETSMRKATEAILLQHAQLALTCYYAALHALNSVVLQEVAIHQKILKVLRQLVIVHKNDTNSLFLTEKQGYVDGHESLIGYIRHFSKFRSKLDTEAVVVTSQKLRG